MPKERKIWYSTKERDFPKVIDWMDFVAPWECRVMAKKKDPSTHETVRMTVDEIVKLSGIPRRTVQSLSYRKNWSGVDTDVMSRFAWACNVNLLASDPKSRFMERNYKPGFPHLHPKQLIAMNNAVKK